MFHSDQADAMLEAYTRIHQIIEQNSDRYSTIVDLGCWAGCLSTWIAGHWPKIRVIGVDCAEAMIPALNQGERPENVTFMAADYTTPTAIDGSASLIVSCFGSLDMEHSDLAIGITRLAGASADAIVVLWHDDPEQLLSADDRWDVGVAEFDQHMVDAGWVLQHDLSTLINAATDDGERCSLLYYKRHPSA